MKVLSQEQLTNTLRLHQSRCVEEFFDRRCWTILATGPDDNLQFWAMRCWPDLFDRRNQTVRCRIWVLPDEPVEACILRVFECAKEHEVTIQLLCVDGPDEATRDIASLGSVSVSVAAMKETYPVLFLASHQMKWGDA